MAKCLETVLKESVTDTDLLKLGDIRIHVRDTLGVGYQRQITHRSTGSATFKIMPNSAGVHFTDDTGTANYGTERQLVGYDSCFISPGECDIVINSKYDTVAIGEWERPNDNRWRRIGCFLEINDEDTLGMSNVTSFRAGGNEKSGVVGNVSFVKNLSDNVEIIEVGGNGLEGDIGVFAEKEYAQLQVVGFMDQKSITGNINAFSDKGNLTTIRLSNTKASGNLSSLTGLNLVQLELVNTNVIGNLSSLSSMTALTTLDVRNTVIGGNLSALNGLTNLTSLMVDGTNVTGDTSSLANLTNLTTFTYTNTAITGNWPLN